MSSSRILLGVSASVAGSLGHSLGMTLQKRAHMRLEALANHSNNNNQSNSNSRGSMQTSKMWKDPEWQFGLALYLISSTIPPTIALSMLPVFVAAPLAAVGLVANAVFAKYILSSSFARTDALGTLLVSVGSCCVAAFGAIDEPPLSLDELLLLYKRPAYIMYFVVYMGVVSGMIFAEIYWRRKHCLLSGNRSGADTSVGVGDTVSSRVALRAVSSARFIATNLDRDSGPGYDSTPLASDNFDSSSCRWREEGTPLLDSQTAGTPSPLPETDYASTTVSPSLGSNDAVDEMYRRHFSQTNDHLTLLSQGEHKTTRAEQVAKYISGFLSAIISGLICSQTLLLAKSGIGLVLLTLHGDSQIGDPLALAIVAGLIITALANLYYIQRALGLCSTLTVVPLCYCSSSLSALISSLVYFDQLRLLSFLQITMISVGIVLLASGVVLLSSKADSEDGPLRLPEDSTE
ncbi:hypothetical protein H4R99_006301 [Coemansia sp. RSA 1722]|nr:hypothetical protein LPJ57_005205 [Coemansia sp. RSA 486]KAJ2227521.1 hypothetical protein IWW45_006997 [Coemansia sp. RSA 485]KAJ2592784.1 hypothetical protein H4R99_006301 [Coemansia sp. RSA 1722]